MMKSKYVNRRPHISHISAVLISLLILGLSRPPAVAQNTLWETLNEQVKALYKAGEYDKGVRVAEQALKVAEKSFGPNDPSVATSLNNLAELYRVQGKYAEAEPLFERSLAITEKALGKDHPSVATSLNNLAGLYRAQGKYAEAEPLYERSLAIYEKALGKDHPSVATSLNNLAGLYDEQGKYAEAEPLYERSLAIMEKAPGKDHPDVATSLENMAALYRKTGREEKAMQLEARAKAIRGDKGSPATKTLATIATPPTPVQDVNVDVDIRRATVRREKTLAVIIGNRAYKKMWQTQYAVRDAEWMKTYLVQRMGVAEDNILYLSDIGLSDFQNVFGGQDGNVSRSQIYRRLREKGWDLIVYFSGHGLTDPEEKSNYLLPIDANPDNISATAYRLDALYRNLRQLTDGKITVILESCVSGRTPKGQIGGKASGVVIVDPRTGADTSIDILAAAHSDQVANWYEDQQHGLFTYFLMRALRGAADANADGKVTGAEIKDYVTREVSKLSDRVGVAYQEPEIIIAPDWVWTE